MGRPDTLLGRNHYRLRLRLANGKQIRLLLNADARLVAAADDDDPIRLDAPFVDVPRSDLFGLIGLRVLDPEELEEPVTESKISNLSPRERDDIGYHRPPRIGDVIFNWFD